MTIFDRTMAGIAFMGVAVLLALITIGVFVVLDIRYGWGLPGSGDDDFNAERWRTWREMDGPQRYQMADDLIDDADLIGRSRAEVVALLGEPDGEESVSDVTVLRYFMGRVELTYYWLNVTFREGRASEVAVREQPVSTQLPRDGGSAVDRGPLVEAGSSAA